MDVWPAIIAGYLVVAVCAMIFFNLVDPPRGPLVNEMTEDEARNTVKGFLWPIPLLISIVKLGIALMKHALTRRESRRIPKPN